MATSSEVDFRIGRPSIPPERLLKASLLMAICRLESRNLARPTSYRFDCPRVVGDAESPGSPYMNDP